MEIIRIISFMGLIALAGCGGGGGGSDSNDTGGDGGNGSTPPPQPSVQTGLFLDGGPVTNIGYRTASQEDVTTANGEYRYLPGETVTFFIGDLEFPTTLASAIVTTLDLVGTRDTQDASVVNTTRLLQSLDKDGDPANGIQIDEQAKAAATPVDFSLSEAEFAASSAVSTVIMQGGQDMSVTELVSPEQAVAHLESSLADADLPYGVELGVWLLPTESALLMLLSDGEYFGLQWEEENGFIGFERGRYDYLLGSLEVSVFKNNDGGALLCNVGSDESCQDKPFGAEISGDILSLDTGDDGIFDFNRQYLPRAGIVGIWRLDGSGESSGTLLVFLQSGAYFGIQWGDEASGIEQGIYSYNSDALLISTQTNDDGDALLCNVVASSNCTDQPYDVNVTGDTFTLFENAESFRFSRVL